MKWAYGKRISPKTRVLNIARLALRHPLIEQTLIGKILASPFNTRWAKLVPPEYLYPSPTWRDYDRDGVRLRLDISNVVDHVKYFGFADLGFSRFVSRIHGDATVLDIGANIGVTCLELARRVTVGHVIAFEPSPANFRRLEENVALNRFTNLTLVNLGIGNEAGEFSLADVSASNPGMKRILPAEKAAAHPVEKITLDTLERQLEKLSVVRVDALKLDVEGFELHVLRSATEVIRRDHPIMFIELDDDNLRGQQHDATQLVELLLSLGYSLIDAATAERVDAQTRFAHCHFDLLCIHL